jgi:hypothetical protein
VELRDAVRAVEEAKDTMVTVGSVEVRSAVKEQARSLEGRSDHENDIESR